MSTDRRFLQDVRTVQDTGIAKSKGGVRNLTGSSEIAVSAYRVYVESLGKLVIKMFCVSEVASVRLLIVGLLYLVCLLGSVKPLYYLRFYLLSM